MEINKIYEFITSNAILSETHKQDLKNRRGFTDETIKRDRFFSSGAYFTDIEKKLVEAFKEDELIKSGVFIKDKIGVHLTPMMLEDRIVIPYLDKDGKAVLIRPHKLGLKKIPIQIYHPYNVMPEKPLIITEGEFKASAAKQMGASCIALPGISSFSGDYYKDLVTFLREYKIKNIIIMFDNEDKANAEYPNYKPDVDARYDTQYFAYSMSKRLDRDGFEVRIATLPNSWRCNGKIDIDGALAQGKTGADLDLVCHEALTHKEYLSSMDDECREVVIRKEKKKFFRSHIRVEFGKYIAVRTNGKKEWDDVISNFTLKIIATHETYEGIIREVEIKNENGKSVRFLSLGPEEMSGNDGFSTFCFRHGNFVWSGRKEDLYKIWEMEFLEDSGKHIIEPDLIGWLPQEKTWIFGNVAFNKDKELRPDENGIFWTKDKGFKPVPLGVSSGKSMISEGVPYLNMAECDLWQLRGKLSESIGEYEALTCLGWSCGVLMMEDVFSLYGCFPFLFVTGRRRSGKSTVAEWLMNLFGLENSGKQAADTTAVAIQRYMGYYSSLPFFIDEYRNDLKVTAKNGLFRNAYNRQSAGKGMKSEFGIREAKIRGTLIIAGEETPEDNALLTRCIVVEASESKRIKNNFDWFTQNRQKLSSFSYNILSKHQDIKEKFIYRLKEDKNDLTSIVNDDRLAINKSVVSAGAYLLFGKDVKFANSFLAEIKNVKQSQENESAVSMFFADVQALGISKVFNPTDYIDVSADKIFIYFHGLYNVWAKDYQSRKREAPFKSEAIKMYLKDEKGFLESSYPHRIKGNLLKCVIFDKNQCPDFIKNTVSEGEVGK